MTTDKGQNFDIATNFEDIEEGYTTVTAGPYTMKIADVELTKTNDKKDRMLVKCKVTAPDGEFKGVSATIGINYKDEKSMWVFKRLVKAIIPGDKIDNVKAKTFNTKNFVDKEFDCMATVRQYTKDGKSYPTNDFDSISKAGVLVNANTLETSASPATEEPAADWE